MHASSFVLRIYKCRVVSYCVILLWYWRERLELRNQLTSRERCCQENALRHHLLPLYSVHTLWFPIRRFTEGGTTKMRREEQCSNQDLNDGRKGKRRASHGAARTHFPTGRWSFWNCFELMVSSITKQRFSKNNQHMHWIVPLLYSIHRLLHVSVVVCHHQGAFWIRLS
jgi:hypothetical protein